LDITSVAEEKELGDNDEPGIPQISHNGSHAGRVL